MAAMNHCIASCACSQSRTAGSVGADKGYDAQELIDALQEMKVDQLFVLTMTAFNLTRMRGVFQQLVMAFSRRTDCGQALRERTLWWR